MYSRSYVGLLMKEMGLKSVLKRKFVAKTDSNQLDESIKDYIHWYNIERLHSSLGYLSPLEMEMKLRGIIKKVA